MDPAVLRINKQKKTPLLHELLSACQHSDDQLIPDLQFSFRMQGWHHVSGYCPISHQPPSSHPVSLSLCADVCSTASVERELRQADSDRDLAAQVMKATLQDIQSGSLGPGMHPHLLPVGSLASPRLGITQNSKVRPIALSLCSIRSTAHTRSFNFKMIFLCFPFANVLFLRARISYSDEHRTWRKPTTNSRFTQRTANGLTLPYTIPTCNRARSTKCFHFLLATVGVQRLGVHAAPCRRSKSGCPHCPQWEVESPTVDNSSSLFRGRFPNGFILPERLLSTRPSSI